MENNNYIPKFTTTERNGKIALWVEMPDERKVNIGDISEEDFKKDEIRFAIICAFQRGMEAMPEILVKNLYNQSTYCVHLKFNQ